MYKATFFVVAIGVLFVSAYAESKITFDIDAKSFIPGQIVELNGKVEKGLEGKPVAIEIKDPDGKVILIRTVVPDSDGNFSLKFKVPETAKAGEFDITTNIEVDGEAISEVKSVKTVESESQPSCGPGTVLQNGKCVPEEKKSKEGGGCLIATATFGSELAPQIQFLREIRDNTILSTTSGTSFMTAFNSFYYSFSPAVADLERQNPIFKEAVKVTITPLLSSLSLLQYADIDSEAEMLGYGIGIILLNIGMYFVAPAFVLLKLRSNHRKHG